MIKNICSTLLFSLIFIDHTFSSTISDIEIEKIGKKIWINECNGTHEGLTCWNRGENFASLGIGHFIWYPEGKGGCYEEMFPKLIEFFIEKGVSVPSWMKNSPGCPWESRDRFYEEIQSPKMVSLRQLLSNTIDLQAQFIAQRVEITFIEILNSCSLDEKKGIKLVFNALLKDPKGLFALIDYLNFKGSGISPKEVYQNEGWGLLQVLRKIPPSSKNVVADFVKGAKETLNLRVALSPPERDEKRWLKGWYNRLDSYLKD